jgi:hypothetical protein
MGTPEGIDVLGTVCWALIAGTAIFWETARRAGRNRFPDIGRTGRMLARRLPWRIVFVAVWIFAGVHLIVRYSVPGH